MGKSVALPFLAAVAVVLLDCRLLLALQVTDGHCSALPIVVSTWGFSNATLRAWEVLTVENGTALDAVEQGCSQCERDQCDGTVGYGGSPDEDGETTLDALIIDGPTYSMGAVGDLRRVKRAISVARAVMERSTHTFLVGEKATQFAVEMGFKEESLATNHSKQMWSDWKANNCQPNYRQLLVQFHRSCGSIANNRHTTHHAMHHAGSCLRNAVAWVGSENVVPDPRTSCGPYKPAARLFEDRRGCPSTASELNHDTIGMVVIDAHKRLAAGTSTNGMNHKIPGRIGDSPIPGAGAFADQEVGGAAATGDGDILMRYLPSFHAVESMRRGVDPGSACTAALRYIVRHHPRFVGGIVAVSIDGTYGAACHGIPRFPYSVAKPEYGTVVVEHVECSN